MIGREALFVLKGESGAVRKEQVCALGSLACVQRSIAVSVSEVNAPAVLQEPLENVDVAVACCGVSAWDAEKDGKEYRTGWPC